MIDEPDDKVFGAEMINNTTSSRKNKLASSIKKELAEIINQKQSRSLKNDHRFSGIVSLTEIRLKNYQHINIFVSVLEKDSQTEIVELLNESSAELALQVTQKLKLRTVPKIKFQEDHALEQGSKVLSIINSFSK